MYDEWAGSYAGAARRTEYFRYDGEWKPIPWDAVPKPAYRQLRAMLRDPAQRTLDEENPMTNPRLRPWHIAKGLISPSSTRDATPLTAEQSMAAHEAGYEEASRLQAKYRWSHPGRDFRDEALLNVLGRDRRVPRNLTESDPDFWEWVEAILAGVDDATGSAPVESYRGVSEARPYRGGRRGIIPGSEREIDDCRDAKAMVSYLPYLDTPYAVTRGYSSGSIELCFATVEDARAFFGRTVASGGVERAELYESDKRYPFGRKLIDEFEDTRSGSEEMREAASRRPPRARIR
jgi:hypothetical protein